MGRSITQKMVKELKKLNDINLIVSNLYIPLSYLFYFYFVIKICSDFLGFHDLSCFYYFLFTDIWRGEVSEVDLEYDDLILAGRHHISANQGNGFRLHLMY